MDFIAALDIYIYRGLLIKLNTLGVDSHCYDILFNFITGRIQQNLIDGHLESFGWILSRVTQCILLDPIFFYLYT